MEQLSANKLRAFRSGGFGVALFGGFLVLLGFTAREPQPHPIWFWRYVGGLGLGIILSGFLVAGRQQLGRYATTAFVGCFALSLAIGALVRIKMLMPPQIGLVAVICCVSWYGLRRLYSEDGRAYFTRHCDQGRPTQGGTPPQGT